MMTTEVHKVVRVGDGVSWFDQVRDHQVSGKVIEVLYGRAKCLERGRGLYEEQTVDLDRLRVIDPIIRMGDVVRLAERDQDGPRRAPQGKVVGLRALSTCRGVRVAWEDVGVRTHASVELERVPLAEQHPGLMAA